MYGKMKNAYNVMLNQTNKIWSMVIITTIYVHVWVRTERKYVYLKLIISLKKWIITLKDLANAILLFSILRSLI